MKRVFNVAKKRWYMIVIILVVAGFFINQKTTADALAKKQSTYTVTRETLEDTLSLSGAVDAQEHVTLQFQTPGLLSWVGVKEGDYVKKNQGIAALDQRSVTKNLQTSLNTYAKSRNTFDQSRDDNQRVGDQPNNDVGNKMKRLVENAQYDLNSTVLAVELQDLARQYSYLSTPIEGIVIRADALYAGVNIGVTTGYEIVNPKTIFFAATADQTDVVKLQNGMTGQISLDAYPDKKMSGSINFISFIPKSGETGTVYEVKLGLNEDNTQNAYRLGMTGDAVFVMDKKVNVVTVESNFVKSERDKKYVWRLNKDKKEKVYIKTGLEIDGKSEVLSGIREGDVLVNLP